MSQPGITRSSVGAKLRVVTERMPELRSVAVGFWVGTGSVDEPGPTLGASHFLEHLLFKGTATRSAANIAREVESVGGDMNAFTTQEYTAFYVRVPDDHLALALDILSDVVWSPALRNDEVESERKVILEELRMRDDAPDDVVHEEFAAALFDRHPLGRAILGTGSTIEGMARDEIAQYHDAHYRPANVVVAAAGALDHAHVEAVLVDRLRDREGDRPERAEVSLPPPRSVAVVRRATEQAHVVLGARAPGRSDPDRFALAVVNQALGGGMSSRLFQAVREERGLAYSIYSYRVAYEGTGAAAIYVGTAPERLREALTVIEGELDHLVADGIGEEELDAAKGHLKGSTALSLETSASRMHRIGRSELTLGEVPSVDDLVAEVDSVTADDVARVIQRTWADPLRTLAVVGPFDESDFPDRERPEEAR